MLVVAAPRVATLVTYRSNLSLLIKGWEIATGWHQAPRFSLSKPWMAGRNITKIRRQSSVTCTYCRRDQLVIPSRWTQPTLSRWTLIHWCLPARLGESLLTSSAATKTSTNRISWDRISLSKALLIRQKRRIKISHQRIMLRQRQGSKSITNLLNQSQIVQS